jgi:flagellar motor switch protein FliM
LWNIRFSTVAGRSSKIDSALSKGQKMNSRDLLSQDEIDALLSNESVGVGAPSTQGHPVKSFDLASQRHVPRHALPGFECLNQRFAEQFRVSLSRLLGQTVDVVPQKLQYSSFGSYQHSLYIPSSLSLLKLAGLNGGAMIMADARLVFRLVDLLFGGSGKSSSPDGRGFSVAEQRLIERFSELLMADLSAAWEPLVDLQCQLLSREVNPVMAVLAGSSDTVVVSRFLFDSNGSGGEFHLVFPLATIEPLRDALLRPELLDRSLNDDPSWRAAFEAAVLDTQVATQCTLAERDISLRTLTQMQVGDVIKLGDQDRAVFRASGTALFRARLGVIDDRLALKLGEAL